MKLLLEIVGAGHVPHGHEPALESEIVAFVKALIKSRTRVEPPVVLVWLGENDVCVNADALLRLQEKADALTALVTCSEQTVGSHMEHAINLVKAGAK